MMGFSDEGVLLLTKLDQARMDAEESGNHGWITLENYDARLIGSMKRNKYIEERLDSLPVLYRITDKGHGALMKELAAPQGKQKKRGKVSPLYENGNGNGIHAQVQALPPLTAEPCSPDGCDGQCVYQQVVEILEQRVPGTRELVEALKLLNKAR